MNVHSSIIHNSENVEATQMSINETTCDTATERNSIKHKKELKYQFLLQLQM